MILIIFAIVSFVQGTCNPTKVNETVYITKGETLRINLAVYMYGTALTYSIPTTSRSYLQAKVLQKKFTTLKILSEMIDWDLTVDSITNKWLRKGMLYSQSNQYQVTYSSIESTTFDQSIKFTLTAKTNCYNYWALSYKYSLIDCSAQGTNIQVYVILDLINKTSRIVNMPNIYVQGDIIGATVNEREYFFKIQNKITIYKHEILADSTIKRSIQFNKTFTDDGYNEIKDFKVHDNKLYYLIKPLGIVEQQIESQKIQSWKLFDDFDKLSIFKLLDGNLTALIGSQQKLYKIQLQKDGQIMLTVKYEIDKIQQIISLYHSDKYSIFEFKQGKEVSAFVFDRYDRLYLNRFYTVQFDTDQTKMYFDPMSNELMNYRCKNLDCGMWRFSFNDPLLYVDQDSENPVIVKGVDYNSLQCQFEFSTQILKKEDKGLYVIGNLNPQVTVLNTNLNSLPLLNVVIGANIVYDVQVNNNRQAVNKQESMYYFQNVNSTIMNPTIIFTEDLLIQKMQIYSYFRVALQDSPLKYLLITQYASYELIIWMCFPPDSKTKTVINCTERFVTQLTGPIMFITSEQYRQPISVIYYVNGQNVDILTYDDKTQQVKSEVALIEPNPIDALQIYKDYFYILQVGVIKMYKLNNRENVLNITPYQLGCTEIFNVQNRFYDYYIYVQCEIGILIIDPGLYGFGLVRVDSHYATTLTAAHNMIIVKDNILIDDQKSIQVINARIKPYLFFQKDLQFYGYEIPRPLKYTIGSNSTIIYIQAVKNAISVVMCFKIDNSQIDTFFTQIEYVNIGPISVISLFEMDLYHYVNKKHHLEILRVYRSVELLYTNPGNQISVIFNGLDSQELMLVDVDLQNNEDRLIIKIADSTPPTIDYTNDTMIKLPDSLKSLVSGSINRWNLTCEDCPRDLQMINYLDGFEQIGTIPGLQNIKHNQDYVFIQQDFTIVLIDQSGNLDQFIQLPIHDPTVKCSSVAVQKSQTSNKKYLITVCNNDFNSIFYITSMMSSAAFAMGPYSSQVRVYDVSHMRLINDQLVMLDQSLGVVYIFDLDLEDPLNNELHLAQLLDSSAFVLSDQQIIYFDVAQLNSDSYVIYLLTSSNIVVVIPCFDGVLNEPFQVNVLQQVCQQLNSCVSNIEPLALIIVDSHTVGTVFESIIIILNRNFDHFEFDIDIHHDGGYDYFVYTSEFVASYQQYGYFQATGKARTSDAQYNLFAVMYDDPFQISKEQVLIVYQRNETFYQSQLGGYTIQMNSNTDQSLIDFLHQGDLNKIVIVNGSNVNQITVNNDLFIKVNNIEFKDQELKFTIFNDFQYQKQLVSFIQNYTGNPSLLVVYMVAGLLVLIILMSVLIVMHRRRKAKLQIQDAETDLFLD